MKMTSLAMLLITLSSLAISAQPTILVEAEDLLKAIAVDTRSQGVNLYDWKLADGSVSPIVWNEEGNRWTQEGFERHGEVLLSNNGKITHNVVGDTIEKGKWKLFFLGSKDKITKVTITPNATTQENPHIEIQKQYIREKYTCSSEGNATKEVLLLKYPSKRVFWMKVATTSSPKGQRSVYVITFDKKPECLIGPDGKSENSSGNGQDYSRRQMTGNYQSNRHVSTENYTQNIKSTANMFEQENSSYDTMQTYYARISQRDHYGRNNQKLKGAGTILQQDRANYHKHHRRDREDTGDSYFDTRNHRDKIRRMLARGSTSQKTLDAIRYGTPLVKVAIYENHIDVSLVSGGVQSRQKQHRKAKSSRCNTTGYIRGIDRYGDGFIAVRKGPGAGHRMINKIYHNGTKVKICGRQGKWKGIVYGDCIEDSSRSSSGSCVTGWVYGKYVR